MTTKIYALLKEEDNIPIKIHDAVQKVLKDVGDINPAQEASLEEMENPDFVVISIDSYNINQLESLKKMHPDSLLYWGNAITFYTENKSKKK